TLTHPNKHTHTHTHTLTLTLTLTLTHTLTPCPSSYPSLPLPSLMSSSLFVPEDCLSWSWRKKYSVYSDHTKFFLPLSLSLSLSLSLPLPLCSLNAYTL